MGRHLFQLQNTKVQQETTSRVCAAKLHRIHIGAHVQDICSGGWRCGYQSANAL